MAGGGEAFGGVAKTVDGYPLRSATQLVQGRGAAGRVWDKQCLQLAALGRGGDGGQPAQQPGLHARESRGHQAFESSEPRQQHPLLPEPGRRQIEEHLRPLVGHPCALGEPAGQVEGNQRIVEIAIAIVVADQLAVAGVGATAAIARRHRHVIDADLTGDIGDDAGRYGGEVGGEGAQEPDAAELQGKTQAVGGRSLGDEELDVRVVQVEARGQLQGVWLTGEAAVSVPDVG